MSKAFEEAISLTDEKPMKKDIIERLDDLRFQIDIDENIKFDSLYESVYIEIEESTQEAPPI